MSINRDYVSPFIILAPAARIVTFSTDIFKFPYKEFTAVLDVSASEGGTELLDVDVEEYDPAADAFAVITSFTQATGVTNERIFENEDGATPFGPLLRVTSTIAGTTPSFTYSLVMFGKK